MRSLTTTHIVLLGLALHSAALPLIHERRYESLIEASDIEDVSKRGFCQGVLDCLQGSDQSSTAAPENGAAQDPVTQQPGPNALPMQPIANQGPPAQGQGQSSDNVKPGKPRPQHPWRPPPLDPIPEPVIPPTALRPPPRRYHTMMTPATSPATEEPAQPITPNRHKPSSSVSATFGFFPSSSSQGEDSASASGSGSATRSGNRSLGGASPSLKGSKVSPFKGTKQASKKQISKNLKKLAPGTSVKLTKGVKATTASRSSIPSVGRSYAKITHPKGKAASGPPKTNRNGGRKSGSAKQTPAKSPAKVNMKAPKVQAPKVVKAGKKGVRQGVQNSKANVARKPNRPARPQPPSRKPVAKPSAAGGKKAASRRTK